VSAIAWTRVLFDLDGTVVDTIPLILASYEHALASVLGEPLDEPRARRWIGRSLVETLGNEYPDDADALVDAYLEFNQASMRALLRRVGGMDEALGALRAAGVQTGVATSKRRSSAHDTLELAGLAEAFEVVVTAEDTPTHKPDPAPLLLAAQRVGGTGPVVYVGDAVVDIEAAHAAGFAAIAVTWGAGDLDDLRQAYPAAIVQTPAELVRLVLG